MKDRQDFLADKAIEIMVITKSSDCTLYEVLDSIACGNDISFADAEEIVEALDYIMNGSKVYFKGTADEDLHCMINFDLVEKIESRWNKIING